MKKDEALKLALEALDIVNPNEFSQADPEGKIDKAITAIKKALAQPEPSCTACEGNPSGDNNPCAICGLAQPEQEPVDYEKLAALGWESQEALNIAKQCRATASSSLAKNILVDGGSGLLAELLIDAAGSLEALAQPEPDDFMLRDVLASELKCWHRLTGEEAQNLIDFIKHTSPPQRKPLTDEQRREVYKKAEAQLYTVPNKPWLDALIEQTEIAHGIKGDA